MKSHLYVIDGIRYAVHSIEKIVQTSNNTIKAQGIRIRCKRGKEKYESKNRHDQRGKYGQRRGEKKEKDTIKTKGKESTMARICHVLDQINCVEIVISSLEH